MTLAGDVLRRLPPGAQVRVTTSSVFKPYEGHVDHHEDTRCVLIRGPRKVEESKRELLYIPYDNVNAVEVLYIPYDNVNAVEVRRG